MHRKNIFYLLTSIILLLFIYILNKDKKSSIASDNNFFINDVSQITKIFLSDRSGNTITLDRKDDKWIVNQEYIAREEAINNLLKTISEIKIKKPVSKAAFENVVKFMATSGVSVEIFNPEGLIKSYIIGSNTPDHLGTYMLLKDSEKPFVIYIPYFNGFVSPRYGIEGQSLNPITWRETNVFNIKPDDIKSIEFTDLLNKTNSYRLELNPTALYNYSKNRVNINTVNMQKLLSSFRNVNCESFKNNKDAIQSAIQLHTLVVNKDTLRTYRLSKSNIKKKEENFNVKRKYATLNNGDLMLIQDYVFNKVLITINELKE